MPMDDLMPADADLIDALSELLEREAVALKTADFAALGPLAADKERLAGQVAECVPRCAPAIGRDLQARAQRNAMLLEAAQAGLRDAQTRIHSLREPPAPLQTYDGKGRRARLDIRPDTERRA